MKTQKGQLISNTVIIGNNVENGNNVGMIRQ